MKRSEMIEKISNIVSLYRHMPNDFISNEGFSEVLLNVIESNGMLPPDNDTIIEGHLCTVNKWEPEDEA